MLIVPGANVFGRQTKKQIFENTSSKFPFLKMSHSSRSEAREIGFCKQQKPSLNKMLHFLEKPVFALSFSKKRRKFAIP